MRKMLEVLLLFAFMLGVFLILLDRRTPQVIPTPIPATSIPAIPIPASPIPSITSLPPIEPQVIPPEDNTFNGNFFTATVCNNVPVFSQPAPNYHLIIGELYKGNLVDVTGQSQFWSRISYLMGQVGYIPTDYIEC